MESEHPRLIKACVAVGCLFLVSAFKSCTDLQYRLVGKTTTGNVTKIAENQHRGEVVDLHVTYGFKNENSHKHVTFYSAVDLEDGDKYQVGQSVPIEYFGDEGYDSRIVGTGSPFWTRFFLGSIAAAVVVGIVLSWQCAGGSKSSR